MWPPAATLVAACAAVGVLRHRGLALWFAVAVAAAVAGFANAKLRTDLVAAPVVPREMTVNVDGWIAWIEEAPSRGDRIYLRVRDMEDMDPVPRTVRFTVAAGAGPLSLGDGLTALVRVIPPGGPALPGGYDFARAAYFDRIGAVGFAYGTPEPADLGPAPWDIRLLEPFGHLREAVRDRVEAALPGDTGEIAAALITGDRGGISDETQEAMRASGLGHVLAISGLHMALVAGSAFWIVRALLALSSSLVLRRPIKKWAAAAALATAAFYLALSGAGIATQRAFVMLAVMLAAILLDRRAITLRNVAIAALIVLAMAPEALLSVSFQMSFAATAALVAAYEALRDWRASRPVFEPRGGVAADAGRSALALVFTSLVAGLATAPFALYHFQRVAPLTLAANLAAMPAVGLLIMPMALLAVLVMPLGLESAPLAVMGLGIDWLIAVARQVSAWSGDAGLFAKAPAGALAVFAAGFVWLVIRRDAWRLAGAMPILLAAYLAASAERPDLVVDEAASAVAVRGEDGRYHILRRLRAGYEIGTWLRSDGDGRDADDPGLEEGVRCDDLGCVFAASTDGPVVALTIDDLALAEDCRMADVIVTRHDVPAGCGERALVIDGARLNRFGAHALYDVERREGTRIATAYRTDRRPFMAGFEADKAGQ